MPRAVDDPPRPPAITLAGQIDLARVVDLTATRLGVRIDYDPAIVQGKVTVRGQEVGDEGLWDLMHALLAGRGLTTVVAGDADGFTVVRLAEAAGIARARVVRDAEAKGTPPTREDAKGAGEEEPGAREREGAAGAALRPGFTAEILTLRFRTAREVSTAIKPVLSRQGSVAESLGEASPLLLLADLTPRVDDAKKLIAILDRPAEVPVVEELELANLPASRLLALATAVVNKQAVVEKASRTPGDLVASASERSLLIIAPRENLEYWRELVRALDKREPLQTRSYSVRYFGVKDVSTLIEQTIATPQEDGWKLVVDELTGSLIITATASQHEAVQQTLARVDVPPAEISRPVRAFPIRNRPVQEVVQTLGALIDGGALGAGAVIDPTLAPALPGPEQRTLVPDTSVGRAVPPRDGGEGGAAAPGAGREREAGEGGGRNLDLTMTADEGTNTLIVVAETRVLEQVESLIAMLDVRQPQVSVEVFLLSISDADTLDLGVELEKLDSIGDASVQLASLFGLSSSSGGNRVPSAGGGFTGAVLSPGEFNVIVRALQTINKGRTQSLPRVLVNNNQQATFSSVLQQPFSTTNASSSNVTTTTFGGTQDAGTTISIRPQIAEGDHLVLEYTLSLSSFIGNPTAGGLPPPRQQNNVTSKATIPDGYTVVVGGLELTSESNSVSQIPILGNIPILGELFKNRGISSTRSRFVVFIRANVQRDPAMQGLLNSSAGAKAEMGLDDGEPRLTPRVIR